MTLDDPHDCQECGARRADVLPSRGECQTCLKARLAALDWFAGSPTDAVFGPVPLGESLVRLFLVRSSPPPEAPPVSPGN